MTLFALPPCLLRKLQSTDLFRQLFRRLRFCLQRRKRHFQILRRHIVAEHFLENCQQLFIRLLFRFGRCGRGNRRFRLQLFGHICLLVFDYVFLCRPNLFGCHLFVFARRKIRAVLQTRIVRQSHAHHAQRTLSVKPADRRRKVAVLSRFHHLRSDRQPFRIRQIQRAIARFQIPEPGNSAVTRQPLQKFRFIKSQLPCKIADHMLTVDRNLRSFRPLICRYVLQVFLRQFQIDRHGITPCHNIFARPEDRPCLRQTVRRSFHFRHFHDGKFSYLHLRKPLLVSTLSDQPAGPDIFQILSGSVFFSHHASSLSVNSINS